MDELGIETFTSSLERSAKNLNDAYKRFNEEGPADHREFVEIKLQCCIFQYDLCREMASIMQQRPTGFAQSVALKGLVHKLFEYEALVKKTLRPRLLALAASREIEVDRDALSELDAQSRPALKELRKWVDVRNRAAGHYDADIKLQADLIRSITFDHVMDICCAFIRYNMGLLIILRDAGTGPVTGHLIPP